MEHRERADAGNLLRRRRSRKARQRVVMCLAALVLFCTTYALILPALTLEQDTRCGLEPHTHSEACYSTQSTLTCGLPEQPAHIHTEACYASEQSLTCTEEHEHTETCYETHAALACGLEETEGHTHGADCFETEQVLCCGKEEHTHTEICRPEEEAEPSGGEEPADTPELSPDPGADLETREDWEATLNAVELTGSRARDVLLIAESQLGYRESQRNFVTDDTGTVRGYTRYGAWYGEPYGDWCAMFVSFCLYYAEVKDFPPEADCGAWLGALSEEACGLYHGAGTYVPEPGDLVFFDWNDNDSADHVGIVAELIPATEQEPEKLKTIEGNSGDQVRYEVYFVTDERIMGYGALPEQLPEVTVAAAAMEEPAVTEAPIVSEEPIVSEAPIVSEEPVATKAPVVSEAPAATETPIVTKEPVVSEEPIVTEAPAITEEPIVTEEPAAEHQALSRSINRADTVSLTTENADEANSAVSAAEGDTGAIQTVETTDAEQYELPETGGSGTVPYTIGGALMAAGALLAVCLLRRGKERRFSE